MVQRINQTKEIKILNETHNIFRIYKINFYLAIKIANFECQMDIVSIKTVITELSV